MAIAISDEVQTALYEGLPIVGLESSNITGGKYPSNLEIAHDIDAAVRSRGAIPARIAVLRGKLQVGTSQEDLELLAHSADVEKVSNRELGIVANRGQTAGTTVSASLVAAGQAGIRVFGVAGIGGVHRGADTSFDISADLPQFAQSPLLVVCAGAKSLLDPRLTLEWLETYGIPVISYGYDDFPGYFAQSTGEPAPARSEDLTEIASIAHHHWREVGSTSVLVTSPIRSHEGIGSDRLQGLITDALRSAEDQGAHGGGLTPFVLRALADATAGQTAEVNKAVLMDTVTLAADTAVAEAEVHSRIAVVQS